MRFIVSALWSYGEMLLWCNYSFCWEHIILICTP